MRKRPTPETDAVAAYEGNWDTKALRMTAHSRKLERERDELRQWKKEMLLVESQWDEQIVGRLLGLQLGDYIKPNIEPKLRQLIRERDEARELVYAWESRWKAEVEFACRVSVKRDELLDILRKLLEIIPEPECHDFGHTKEERHTFFEKCPVMERYDALIAQAEEAAK